MYVFANFIVFDSILGFYEFIFSIFNCIYCRKNHGLYFLFIYLFFWWGWGGGGGILAFFFVVVVSCFIFRECLTMPSSKCFVDLVASQDRKSLLIICVLLSPAVGVLHIMFKIFIMMLIGG